MAEYSPSKIIKDGNTYNFRDTTKIPLSGSNAISGDLIPSTDGTVNLGGSSYQWNNAYIKSLTINGTAAGDILTHNASEFVPRSGGPVITNDNIGRNINNKWLALSGGRNSRENASIWLYGKEHSNFAGQFWIGAIFGDYASACWLTGTPNGTLTWKGQPIQYGSDQRLKQQITEIDDKLLDAWEDVAPVQFKYNDAVETKGDKARLHTGYVVQQIQKACESHGVDISAYGLFCHEEYPEETEEVEVEQKDGTKTKERKVIREASEHYSLRYTEALIVECKYLRKCIKELRNEIEELKSSK